MNIDIISIWIGRIILFSLALLFIGLILWLVYLLLDTNFKRLLGWKNREARADVIYFIKNKDKIKEYITKFRKQ